MATSILNKITLVLAIALSCSSCIAQEPYVRLKGEKFSVEIADTPDKLQLGLMFRESMPEDHGMLFIFSGETMRGFWMKNTKIPLDIIYFDKDLKLVSVSNAKPCRTRQCPNYPSTGPAMYVLELNAGLAEKLELEPGDLLEVHLPGR
jgi:uncharacterized membrane protein (UPF0127 family)